MSVKIAFDVSTLSSGHAVRGVGVYTQHLTEAIKAQLEKPEFQDIAIDFIDFINHQPASPKLQRGESATRNHQYNLVHYPYFDLFFLTLPLRKPAKTVVTIHDVIPLVFPEHYPPGIKGKLKFQVQKFSLRSVDAVITDSQNSQRDVVKYLGFPKERIHVIYLAPAKIFKPFKLDNSIIRIIEQKYKLPEKFILYVGDVNWNKNIQGLIRAFAQIQQRIGLVLVGKAFSDENLWETKQMVQLIKELKLEDEIIRLGWVEEEDLVKIYNLATVYCQPSFYEGFGLPVLEAMACGCPVVAAKTSSLPEICGEAAVMVDPNDDNDIAKGLEKVIRDKKARDMLIKKGLEQAKKFSWEKTAKGVIDAYQKVLS